MIQLTQQSSKQHKLRKKMKHFRFDKLPDDIAGKIFRLVGREGIRELLPLLMTGKECRRIVLSTQVLATQPLPEFMEQPSLMFPDGAGRDTFNLCLQSNNPTACYLEGIRQIFQEGHVDGGLSTMEMSTPTSDQVEFARAIILICNGQMKRGRKMIRRIERKINSWDAVDDMGIQLFEHVREMFGEDDYVGYWPMKWDPEPRCVLRTCSMQNRCPSCYVYWITVAIYFLH